ncbi:hypothetical protein LCGC14_2055660 [marine sediment metagenome]|uniref:Uncharacterized protein n=1 Tax=marine sediment metagenome TaxID=412755 RepID=A0A0F9EMP2_9ZZZZ
MLEEVAIWGLVILVGLFACVVWKGAYDLHMQNDREDGPCAFHRWWRHW